MQFQHYWPKDRKITPLFLAENLEKNRSTELYDAPLEGSTIFLYRSSTSRSPLESFSFRFAELNMHFLARQDVRIKNTALKPLSIDDL